MSVSFHSLILQVFSPPSTTSATSSTSQVGTSPRDSDTEPDRGPLHVRLQRHCTGLGPNQSDTRSWYNRSHPNLYRGTWPLPPSSGYRREGQFDLFPIIFKPVMKGTDFVGSIRLPSPSRAHGPKSLDTREISVFGKRTEIYKNKDK